MKCFYHSDADAVGTCRYCARGICKACAAEREGGIACVNRHEEQVDVVSNLVQRSVRLAARSTPFSTLAVLVYWSAMLIFGYLAWTSDDISIRILFLTIGALMLVAAIANTRILLTRGKN
jgi:hypothetical protein